MRTSPTRPSGIGVTASRSTRAWPLLYATAWIVTDDGLPVDFTSNAAGMRICPGPTGPSTCKSDLPSWVTFSEIWSMSFGIDMSLSTTISRAPA
jgi:hypothetical protein